VTDSVKSEPPIELAYLNADHLPYVTRLERESFTDPWPESAFRDLMVQSRTSWVALRAGEVAGYLVTQWVLDEIHILNIAVAGALQRGGIASFLLDFLIDTGAREGMHDLYLEVRASNDSAKALYAKFGFQQLSSRRAYYADGEDALVLHRRIPARRADRSKGE